MCPTRISLCLDFSGSVLKIILSQLFLPTKYAYSCICGTTKFLQLMAWMTHKPPKNSNPALLSFPFLTSLRRSRSPQHDPPHTSSAGGPLTHHFYFLRVITPPRCSHIRSQNVSYPTCWFGFSARATGARVRASRRPRFIPLPGALPP